MGPPTPFNTPPPPTPPPAPPPTPPPTQPRPTPPVGPVDPYNCAIGAEGSWDAGKKAWCCRVHLRGCDTPPPTPPFVPPPTPPPFIPPPMPTASPRPADPY